jgi:hypothetical protein
MQDGNSAYDFYVWVLEHASVPGEVKYPSANSYPFEYWNGYMNTRAWVTTGTLDGHAPLNYSPAPSPLTISVGVSGPPAHVGATVEYNYTPSVYISDFVVPSQQKADWKHDIDWLSPARQQSYTIFPMISARVANNQPSTINFYGESCFSYNETYGYQCQGYTFNNAQVARPGDSTAFASLYTDASTVGGQFLSMWTTYTSGGYTQKQGFTPIVVHGGSGQPQTVTVSDYGSYFFHHWEDNTTNRVRTVTPTSDPTQIIAYYTVGAGITVNAKQTSNNAALGMWTTIYNSQNQVVHTGFTTTGFGPINGQTYTIVPSDYNQWTFHHWDNGSTNRNRVVTYTGSQISVTAYYSCAYSCL